MPKKGVGQKWCGGQAKALRAHALCVEELVKVQRAHDLRDASYEACAYAMSDHKPPHQ